MSVESWDAEHAEVTKYDEDEPGERPVKVRYGVTAWESSHHEPLNVALSQEVPDPIDVPVADDQWLDVEENDEFPGRLVPDGDGDEDEYALATDDADEYAAEELAMHVVES